MKKYFLFLLGIVCYANQAPAAQLKVTNLRNQTGFIGISVFAEDQKSLYPEQGERAYRSYYVPIDRNPMELDLSDLEPGRYAFALLHDENGDRKLNTGFMGIPKEGYGFSNNPRVAFGAPDFETVLIQVNADSSIEIKAKYNF